MLAADREYGKKSGFNVPFLNMGAMRFPENVDEAVKVIRYAIDCGYKYIDTSRFYDDSELKLKIALQDGYREKVVLSTKWSVMVGKIESDDDDSADCMLKRIEESMTRLGVDHLDFYQLWCVLDLDYFNNAMKKNGMVDGMKKAKELGLVSHLGMTTHDTAENIISVIPQLDWCESVLMTYNILATERGPSLPALKAAGIATTVMNPLSGGTLAKSSPVMDSIARSVNCESTAEMAVRYIMANDSVDCIMHGINKISDVDDSIKAFNKGALTKDQACLVDEGIAKIVKDSHEFCTGCGYCMPCPVGIEIPKVMTALIEERFWGRHDTAKTIYDELEITADYCQRCRVCESRCTQKLDIVEEMVCAKRFFG